MNPKEVSDSCDSSCMLLAPFV